MMSLRMLLFPFLLLTSFSSSVFAACQPSADSCEAYLCREQEMSCGPQGYWMGYAYPYCEIFLREQEQYAPVCQGWLRKVRLCLQNQVNAFEDSRSCLELHRKALRGHIDCYVETGFCELPIKDRMQVLWTLRGALATPETWAEAFLLARSCR